MMYVHRASVQREGEHIRICCDVDLDGETRSLFFRTDAKYEPYVTVDRADAFLVMLFYFAMQHGHDLSFESPLSETLFYQIQLYLVEAFHRANPSFRQIRITCPNTVQDEDAGSEVGTGMSCGVDSLYTLAAHGAEPTPSGFRLTHLAYFNAGGFQYDDGRAAVNPNGESVFLEQLRVTQACAEDAKLPLLVLDSNLATCFPGAHIRLHPYRDCGAVLLFQKLFGVYYYSSGYTVDRFRFLPHSHAAFYDLFSVPLLSTGSTRFYSFSPAKSRLEKTAALVNDPLANKHLLVCAQSSKNCGTCRKCVRTLLTLDALDALERFDAVFDLAQYQKTRVMQIGYCIAKRKNEYYGEIYPLLKSKRKIPALSWAYGLGFWLLQPLERWLVSRSPAGKQKAVRLAKKLNLRLPW